MLVPVITVINQSSTSFVLVLKNCPSRTLYILYTMWVSVLTVINTPFYYTIPTGTEKSSNQNTEYIYFLICCDSSINK